MNNQRVFFVAKPSKERKILKELTFRIFGRDYDFLFIILYAYPLKRFEKNCYYTKLTVMSLGVVEE